MTLQEVEQNYSKEVYEACKLLRTGKRKLTLEEKGSIGSGFDSRKNNIHMVGPICESGGTVYDGVLIKGNDSIGKGSKFANVIRMLKEGNYEDKIIQFDEGFFNRYPGNIVSVVENKKGSSIYENKYLNKNNKVSEEYMKKIHKAQISDKLCFVWQMIAWALNFVFFCVVLFSKPRNPGFFRFFISFVSTLPYLTVLVLLKKYYIKKYTKDIYDNIFINRAWIFYLLNIFLGIRYGLFR